MDKNYSIQIDHQPSEEDIRFVGLSLRDYNQSIIGEQAVHPLEMIIFDQKGTIIAGASCTVIWGWGSLEQFWIHPDYRQTDLSDQLLHLMQNQILRHGVDKIHGETILDHVKQLFTRNHYQLFAQSEDRPPGHTTYYYKAENIQTQPVEFDPTFTLLHGDQVTDELLAKLKQQINTEYDQLVGEVPFKFIRVFARNREDQIIGGLNGYIGWGWFYVMTLWVDEKHRGQSLGTQLLKEGEEEALRLGVNQAFLGTTEFQARGFYEKNGYQVFGHMDDLPPGYKNFMMRKTLS